MLDSAQTIVTQIFIMFLLMLVGHLLYRRRIIDSQGSQQLSSLLLNIVTPAVLITSFQRPFAPGEAKMLATAFFFALLSYVPAILLARLLYGRSPAPYAKDAQMCLIFSNNGFMALPLLEALLGSTGVFLGSAGIVTGTVIAWTYGARMLSGESRVNFKKILLNPGTLALIGGLLLFCSPWKLGIYLSQSHVLACLKDKTVYLLSVLKLAVIPLLAMALLYLLGASELVATALLIGTAAPSGVISAMMAQMFGTDHLFSTRIIAVTTLFSAVTMPLFLLVLQLLW